MGAAEEMTKRKPTTADAFGVALKPMSDNVFAYSVVSIDRYSLMAPIPEPRTYVMLLIGLAAVGLAAMRRRELGAARYAWRFGAARASRNGLGRVCTGPVDVASRCGTVGDCPASS
jgi:hypothetical protein